MLTEEEVYNGTKKILIKNNYTLLAGQPPRGVDHLPVLEIKSGLNKEKGSKDSFKPDLVAYRDEVLIIIECKPDLDNNDYKKLQDILTSENRLYAFFIELKQRGLLAKINNDLEFNKFKEIVHGGLAYSYNSSKRINQNDLESSIPLYHILVETWQGKGKILNP